MSDPGTASVRRSLTYFDRALRVLDKVLMAVCGALLMLVFVVIIVSVFYRYVLNSSLMWSEELARYATIWMVFLGLSCAHRRSEHVSLQSVLSKIPVLRRHSISVRVTELLNLTICVAITVWGAEATAGNFLSHQISPAMQIGIAWIYLAIPVGFGVMSMQSIERLWRGSSMPMEKVATEDLLDTHTGPPGEAQ